MVTGSLEMKFVANVEAALAEIRKMEASVAGSMNEIERTAAKSAAGIARLGTALKSLATGVLAKELVSLADGFAKYDAQLRLASRSEEEYAAARSRTRQIAAAANTELTATGALYARIATGTRELGLAEKTVGDLTEVVALALKVSGAAASESASATLQLSQAFAAGVLRGEEFNSFSEAAPRLMKALADGMGVPIGQLRSMAAEGRLTSQVLAEALPQALETLRTEAQSITTISGAIVDLKNRVLEFVGEQGKATGAATAAAEVVGLLARNIDVLAAAALGYGAAKLAQQIVGVTVAVHAQAASLVSQIAAQKAQAAAALEQAGASVVQTQSTLGAIAAARAEAVVQLARANSTIAAERASIAAATAAGAQSAALGVLRASTVALTAAEAQRSAALGTLALLGQQQVRVTAATTTAQVALTAAQSAGGVAAGVAARALGLLGGPVGVVITLLGLGAAAWSLWGTRAKSAGSQSSATADQAEAAGRKMTAGLGASIDDLIKRYDDLIAKQREALGLAASPLEAIETDAKKVSERIVELGRAMHALNTGEGFAANLTPAQRDQSRAALQTDIAQALKNQQQLDAKAAEARENAVTQYVTSTARMSAAQQKAAEFVRAEKEHAAALRAAGGDLAKVVQVNAAYQTELASIREKFEKKAASTGNAADSDDFAAHLARINAADKALIESRKAHFEELAHLVRLGRLSEADEIDAQLGKEEEAMAQRKALAEQELDMLKAKPNSLKEQEGVYARLAQIERDYVEARRLASRELELLNFKEGQALEDRYQAARKSADSAEESVRAQQRQSQVLVLEYARAADTAGTSNYALAASLSELERSWAYETAAQLERRAETQRGLDLTGETTEALLRQAQAVRELADLKFDESMTKQAISTLGQLDAYLDPSKPQDFAAALRDSFGEAGDSLAQLTNALQNYAQQQAELDKMRKALAEDQSIDPLTRLAKEMALAKKSAELQVSNYAGMARAAKGFFKEHSAGYKAMEAAEKAFRVIEMAMAMQSTVKKLLGISEVVTATVVGEKVKDEAAFESLIQQLAIDQAKGTSAATVGIATQAQGDPYSAWARMAAMAAVMAALGFAVSGMGGGSGASDAYVAPVSGAGTVLGSDEQSKSISNALELLAANSRIELPITQRMLSVMTSVRDGIASLGSAVSVNTSLRTGAIMPALVNGGELLDSGIAFSPQTIADILAKGIQGTAYTVAWEKKKGASAVYPGLDAGVVDPMNGVFMQMFNAVLDAAHTMKLDDAGMMGRILSLLPELGDQSQMRAGGIVGGGLVSLKDKSGQEAQEELAAVFSALGDQMARAAMPTLAEFQKVGEGMFETVVRVASDIEKAQYALERFGIAAIDYTQIVNKAGDVATEMVRQSVLALEATASGALTGVGKIIEVFSGSYEELFDLYTVLVEVRAAMRDVNAEGDDLTAMMVRGAGGIEKLQGGLSDYYDGFFSQEEQAAAKMARLGEEFARINVAVPESKQAFRALVEGIDTSTDSGAMLFGQLMSLAGAFATATDASAAAAQAIVDAAEAARNAALDAESALARSYFNAVDAQAKYHERLGLGTSAIDKLLGETTKSTSELQIETAKAAADAAKTAVNAWTTAANSIRSALDKIRVDSAALADPAIVYARARAELDRQVLLVNSGDTSAAANVASAANGFLAASERNSASRLDYLRDRAVTEAQLGGVLEHAETQVSLQQSIADASNAQLAQLQALNTNLTGFAAQAFELLSKSYAGADRGAAQSAIAGLAALQGAFDAFFRDSEAGFTAEYRNGGHAVDATRLSGNLGVWTLTDGTQVYFRDSDDLLDIAKRIPELREIWEKDYGIKLPAFAAGGFHAGGLRLVGENGPEIEATGPSRIWNQDQLAEAILGFAANDARIWQSPPDAGSRSASVETLVAEVRSLRAEVRRGNDQAAVGDAAIVAVGKSTFRLLDRASDGGNALRVRDAEEATSRAARRAAA